ncbi:hypothetical protein C5S36_12420 [Candidatus Methanophagaceae archaeon]|nr:hypothetical protein C5S36_12420 [Methanophagales archaeon]
MKKRHRALLQEDGDEPMTGVANLFDVAMVFAVALLVALVVSYNMPELLNPTVDMTVVTIENQNMKVIIKEGEKIKVMNVTEQISEGQGAKVGTAYKLENGEIIYVPEINQTS